MSVLPSVRPAPRAVRIAGIVVAVQGLAGLVFGVAVLINGLSAKGAGANNALGEFGYFAILGLGVLATAAGLLLGYRWARTPATIVQLLLIATGWYAINPSGQVAAGAGVIVLCVLTLALLFTAPARAWAITEPTTED